MRVIAWPLGRRTACVAVVGAALCMFVASSARAGEVPQPPGAFDGRAYELVSKVDKNLNAVRYTSPLSTDGEQVIYQLFGGDPDSTSGASATFRATRTENGWVSENILPPSIEQPGEEYFSAATSPSLSASIWSSYHGLGTINTTPGMTLVKLLGTGGQQSLLQPFPYVFGGNGAEFIGSDDLEHVIANVPVEIDGSHQAGTANVYDFGSGSPELVSRMPGTGVAPVCGVPQFGPLGFATGGGSATSQHWVSADGSRVVFGTSGDTCSDPFQLYMRDLGAGTTTLISGPPLPGDPDGGVNSFLQATPDGSQVFYRTTTSLDPRDDGDGSATDNDIYRWSADSGDNVCVTCAVPGANVRNGNTSILNALVSEDGSHVYFLSALRLADAPAAANALTPNLYVVRNDVVHHVSRVNNNVIYPMITGGASQATPDGSVLFFRSNRSELNALSGLNNGGRHQYYRYDDGDESITCLSCPADGSPAVETVTSDVQGFFLGSPIYDRLRILSDDGDRIVFPMLSEALVPEDVNGGPDIYEWHDGAVGLITDGISTRPNDNPPKIVTISPDGRDILFQDSALLTPEARDGALKLYNARIGGGFVFPTPAPPCEGDGCQGLASTAPALSNPGTSSVRGTGNVVPADPERFAVRRVTRKQRARLARTGSLRLAVRVSAPGRVSLLAQAKMGKRLRKVDRARIAAQEPGRVLVPLQLSKAAKRHLARRGKLRLVVGVSYSRVTSGKRLVLVLRSTGRGR